MSKNTNRYLNDYDDDAEYRQDYYEELKERRKMKRIKNAIRSRNVDDLMRNLDDDYDLY